MPQPAASSLGSHFPTVDLNAQMGLEFDCRPAFWRTGLRIPASIWHSLGQAGSLTGLSTLMARLVRADRQLDFVATARCDAVRVVTGTPLSRKRWCRPSRDRHSGCYLSTSHLPSLGVAPAVYPAVAVCRHIQSLGEQHRKYDAQVATVTMSSPSAATAVPSRRDCLW